MVFRIKFILLLLFLTGCEPPGGVQEEVKINIISHSGINTNSAGEPVPLVVKIFTTDRPDLVSGLEFTELYYNHTQHTVAKLHSDLSIYPDEEESVTIQVSDIASHIVVVAGYRSLRNKKWLAVGKIPKAFFSPTLNQNNFIKIEVKKTGIDLVALKQGEQI